MNHNTMWSSIPPQYTSSGIDRSQMSRASGVIEMTEPSSASVVSHLEREVDDVPDDDDVCTQYAEILFKTKFKASDIFINFLIFEKAFVFNGTIENQLMISE